MVEAPERGATLGDVARDLALSTAVRRYALNLLAAESLAKTISTLAAEYTPTPLYEALDRVLRDIRRYQEEDR